MGNLKVEIPRKLFHIFGILTLLIPLQLWGSLSVALIMGFMLVVLFPISIFKIKSRWTYLFWKVIEFLEREENLKTVPAKQAFSLAAGIGLTALLFSEEVVEMVIVTTAVYDGTATIIGLIWGKHKLPNGKSLEGTIGGVLLNSLFLSFFVPVYYSLITSIFSAVVENLSSRKRWYTDDNFLIPILTGMFLYFLQVPS